MVQNSRFLLVADDNVTVVVEHPKVPVLRAVDHEPNPDGSGSKGLARDVLPDLSDHALSPVAMLDDVVNLDGHVVLLVWRHLYYTAKF